MNILLISKNMLCALIRCTLPSTYKVYIYFCGDIRKIPRLWLKEMRYLEHCKLFFFNFFLHKHGPFLKHGSFIMHVM